jgi:hypothetical protein
VPSPADARSVKLLAKALARHPAEWPIRNVRKSRGKQSPSFFPLKRSIVEERIRKSGSNRQKKVENREQ